LSKLLLNLHVIRNVTLPLACRRSLKQQDSQPVGETHTHTHTGVHSVGLQTSGFVIGSVILFAGHVDGPVFCPVCDSRLWTQCAYFSGISIHLRLCSYISLIAL